MAKQSKDDMATSDPQQTTVGVTEAKSIKYVVVRDGYRVSDKEYDTPLDPECIEEIASFTRIAKNYSHGEKVEAVVYDSKKHRIW